jgi:hypothetical protein
LARAEDRCLLVSVFSILSPGFFRQLPYKFMALFCDVSLPVPLDQAFTYSLPETLRHRV